MSEIFVAKEVDDISQLPFFIYEAARGIKEYSTPEASMGYLPEVIIKAPISRRFYAASVESQQSNVITYWLPNTPWNKDLRAICDYSFLEAWCDGVFAHGKMADYSFRILVRRTSFVKWNELLHNKEVIPYYILEGLDGGTKPVLITHFQEQRLNLYASSILPSTVQIPENGESKTERKRKTDANGKPRVSEPQVKQDRTLITFENETELMTRLRARGVVL